MASLIEETSDLPDVAAPGWLDEAAGVLARAGEGWASGVMLVTVEPSGRVVALEGVGAAAGVDPAASAPGGAASLSGAGRTRVVRTLRERLTRQRELGREVVSLARQRRACLLASRAYQPDWRLGPLGAVVGWLSARDILLAVRTLTAPASAGRMLLAVVSPVGSAPAPTPEDAEVVRAGLPMLGRKAERALGASSSAGRWLSDREYEILRLLARGMSVRAIADQIGRSPHTVHDHVKSLHRKLGARNRGQLIARALGGG